MIRGQYAMFPPRFDRQHNTDPLSSRRRAATMKAKLAYALRVGVLLCSALLVAAGCARPFHSLDPNDAFDPNRQSVVVGHLIMDWRSTQFQEAVDRYGKMTLSVIHEQSGEEHYIVCQDNGRDSRFFAFLPPGKYRLVKWMKGKYFRNMYGSFDVGRGKISYIGTLKWFRGAFDRMHGSLFIDDHHEEEARHFKAAFPNIAQGLDQSIVRLD